MVISKAWILGVVSLAVVLLALPVCAAADSLRILSVETFDEGVFSEGTAPNLSIDLSQETCGEAPDEVEEPFFDTIIATTIDNPLSTELTVTNVRYRIRANASGRYFRTRPLAPSSPAIIEAKQDGRVLSVFLKTDSGSKKAARSAQTLSTDLGVQNLSVIVDLRSSTGVRYRIRKRVSMAFGNYDRCA